MSSNFVLTDNSEIYLITLHRTFKIKTLHLINDLNNRMDHCIATRTKDITLMVNSTYNTDFTETTIDEIINRLNHGEMNELFHCCNVDRLLINYITSPLSDTNATLVCLKPFTNKCLSCNEELDITFNQYVDIFNLNSITKGGVYISSCGKCQQKFYPNFYAKIPLRKKFVTPTSIYDRSFIYFGGKKAYSTELLIHFTSVFLRQYSGFENFQQSYNLTIKKYSNLISNENIANEISSKINREYFSNIWFIYQLCLFTFFINDIREFEIPKLLDDPSIYDFFDINYGRWYGDFVNHWATHHTTHPCRSRNKNESAGCLGAFIFDGMQKVARPICTNKNKYIRTDEFPDGIYTGCGNTPKSKSGLCEPCRKSTIPNDNEAFLLTNDDKGIYDDPLTGCNVSREDRFVDIEKKTSQGIVYTLSPCGIVVGFDELYRSESCYIVLRHFFEIIRLTDNHQQQHLPQIIIYDNACSLFLYFWNRYDKLNINRRILRTPSSDFVSKCLFFIDRFHQRNHKRPMCQKERNINYVLDDTTAKKINTEAAEQRNSVLKQYQNALSSYSSKKVRIAYLILFHLMNTERNTCDDQFEYSRKYAKGSSSTKEFHQQLSLKNLLSIQPLPMPPTLSTMDVMQD